MKERIKLIRNTFNLSQSEMGEKLGLTNATISRMEKGINGVTEQTIKTICREFNIDENWLRNGGADEIVYANDNFSIGEMNNFNSIKGSQILLEIYEQTKELTTQEQLCILETIKNYKKYIKPHKS